MRDAVILVHGLWLGPLAFFRMKPRIEACGFSTHTFGYASIGARADEVVAALVREAAGIGAPRVHFVGHSLGGLIVLAALARGVPRAGRAVLLGSPVRGSRSAQNLARVPGGRRLLGECLPRLVASPPAPPPGAEVGVLAGCRAVGLGRVLPGLPKPNDGAVAVAETTLDGAADSIVLDVAHSQMLVSAPVARQVCAFLHTGRFAR